MNPIRQEKDTVALRLALAEELYAIENERLIFLKKYKIERAVIVLLFLFYLGIFLFYQIVVLKNSILIPFILTALFWVIANKFFYVVLQRHFNQYSKKMKPIILHALFKTSGEDIVYDVAPDDLTKDIIQDSLNAWGYVNRMGQLIRSIKFDDTFIGQKQGAWGIVFGDFYFQVGIGNSETMYKNYHLLKIPNHKKLNESRFEAFKSQLPEFFWVTYDENYQTLLILMEQTKKQKQVMDFELSLKDSLRETKTLEKIQQAFYTNLNSFEDLIALFD